jgi:hypothetical protein
MKRYSVVNESVTDHCCFEASVVDLLLPLIDGDGQVRNGFECMCECFEVAHAEAIAAALNATAAVPGVDELAANILSAYRTNVTWDDLTDDDVYRDPTASPNATIAVFTPPKNHWRAIAKSAIEAVLSS